MRDELERVLPGLLSSMGVCAIGRERKVLVNPGESGYAIRLGLPPTRVDVKLDGLDLIPENLMAVLERGAKRLFYETVQKTGAVAWARNGYGEDPK